MLDSVNSDFSPQEAVQLIKDLWRNRQRALDADVVGNAADSTAEEEETGSKSEIIKKKNNINKVAPSSPIVAPQRDKESASSSSVNANANATSANNYMGGSEKNHSNMGGNGNKSPESIQRFEINWKNGNRNSDRHVFAGGFWVFARNFATLFRRQAHVIFTDPTIYLGR